MSNLEVIAELYRAFRERDYDAFTSICSDDLEWIQNPGFPGGATRHGAHEVIEGVFKAFNNDWETFSYQADEFIDAGSSVIVTGAYVGRHRESGKSFRASTAHIYDLEGGKVRRFRMFSDTKVIWDAIGT